MAVDLFSRWFLIREVITELKSGTLILQMGRNYLQWSLHAGNLLFVSATNPEFWLIHFLFRKGGEIKPEDVVAAELRVSENLSLGAALIQLRKVEPDLLRRLVHEHWVSLSNLLLQSTTRLVWSDRQLIPKPHFIDLSLPFSHLLLALERESVEIRSAVEFCQDHFTTYRLEDGPNLEVFLRPKERRIIHYVRTSAPMKDILMEPEMDRLSSYRVVFLLWLAGQLQLTSKHSRELKAERSFLFASLKSIPPEWIFPLVFGILLGLLLAPKDPPPVENQSYHQEGLEEAVPTPAWSSEKK